MGQDSASFVIAWPPSSRDTAVERAFAEYFREHYPKVEALALVRLYNAHDAESAAAEVFEVVWNRMSQGEPAPSVRWLNKTLRNIIGNVYRAQARRAKRAWRAGNQLLVSDTADATDSNLDLHWALGQLAVAEREVVVALHILELSSEEVAALLGCSASAVRKRAERARNRLRQILGPAEEEAEGRHHA